MAQPDDNTILEHQMKNCNSNDNTRWQRQMTTAYDKQDSKPDDNQDSNNNWQ
jgi:hypothetical protein